MGITKSDLFTKEQNDLAQMARAFAHPARVAIIQYLLQSKTCINNELLPTLGLAQATVSQHLKALKEAGLIKGTIAGNSMSYCIDPKKWQDLSRIFNKIFDGYNDQKQQVCC